MHISTMSAQQRNQNQALDHVPAVAKRALFGTISAGVRYEDTSIPRAELPAIPIRIYTPHRVSSTPRPIAVYFHGGGWTLFGDFDSCAWLPSHLAKDLDAIVVAVNYRLAPQSPFPAAADDSFDAVVWASDNATRLGADPEQLVVFGDSAGGNLSAVVSLKARDAGGPAIAAQGLIYPVTDTVLDDRSMIENATKPVLHQADMVAFLGHYLGDDPGNWASPYAAPIKASSLKDLPPAFIQVSFHDVLRDQAVAYADRLRHDGTEAETMIYLDAPHGWVSYPTMARSLSRRGLNDLVRFFRRQLAHTRR